MARGDAVALARQLGGGQQALLDGARQGQLLLGELGLFEARGAVEQALPHGLVEIEAGAEEDGDGAAESDAGSDLAPGGSGGHAEDREQRLHHHPGEGAGDEEDPGEGRRLAQAPESEDAVEREDERAADDEEDQDGGEAAQQQVERAEIAGAELRQQGDDDSGAEYHGPASEQEPGVRAPALREIPSHVCATLTATILPRGLWVSYPWG